VRIDAHQHYWRLERGDYGWLTPALGAIYRDFGPADLKPHLATRGIARTILVQAAPSEAETHFMLGLASEEPSVAGVVGWTDFAAAGAPERIAALARDARLVGLRPMLHDLPDDDWVLAPRLVPALRALSELGLVFDALVKPRHVARITVLAERHPDLTIVVDHAAKPDLKAGVLDPWRADMAALALRPNVLVKLSGLATEARPGWTLADLAPVAEHLIASFGPQRILWGSDWPVLNLNGDYASWCAATDALLAGLSEAEQAAILGGNAARTYLDGREGP
jgi:L-fuconolactonase